jgi:hypothetical protein
MNTEISEFDSWCHASWGSAVRSHKKLFAHGTPQIRDNFDFDKISPSLKVVIAEKLIIESCSRIGAFQESGDVTWYICSFAREIQDDGDGFTGRRIQPLKAALLLLAASQFSHSLPRSANDTDQILAGGAAVSATYLLAQIEFLCRRNGRYLKDDGTIRRAIPLQVRKKAGLTTNARPNTRDRVSQVHQAFCLYLYRNRTLAGRRLQILDRKLRIVARLRRIRHPVMHGESPDPAAEARFLGLLIAMFYYGDGLLES